MNYPAASCGVSKAHHANASHSVTPEFLVRGPDPDWPVVSPVEPPLKTCGNDGLWIGRCEKRSKPRGMNPKRVKRSCKSLLMRAEGTNSNDAPASVP